MPLYQVIVLSIVQGITELLPVSSSGHLFLTSWLLGWKDEGLAFDIALHLGTLAAVVVYFFRDWVRTIATGLRLQAAPPGERDLLWKLAAASLPIGILGLKFKDAAETSLRSPWVIGAMLIGVGVLMWIGERVGGRSKNLAQVSWLDAMLIGCGQALAIVPGTSRSGITMTAALFRDLDRATAARFSFLLSTPAVAAAGAKAVYDAVKESGVDSLLTRDLYLGIAVSGVTGFLVIAFLMSYLQRSSLKPFIYYRIAFGILVLALAFVRA